MKKRILSVILAILITAGLMPLSAIGTFAADNPMYLEYVSGVPVERHMPDGYIPLSGASLGYPATLGGESTSTWYYADTDITYTSTVYAAGDVNVVLKDGVTVDFNEGLLTSGDGSISIYAQSAMPYDAGTVNATGLAGSAAIGSDLKQTGGTVSIHGGNINAVNALTWTAAQNPNPFLEDAVAELLASAGGDYNAMEAPANVPDTSVDLSAYSMDISGKDDSITGLSMSLALDNKTDIYIYVRSESEPTVSGADVKVERAGERYRITVPNIAAHELATTFNLTIGSLAVKVSAFSYINSVLTSPTRSENYKLAAAALYEYYNAAANYAAE